MPNTSQYYPFATQIGANVLTNAQLNAMTALAVGFTAGIAPSIQVNSVLRQANFCAAMIAKFTADYGPGNVNDDGNLPGYESQFVAALGTLFPTTTQPGRLLRVSVYTKVAGVQNISINGGTPTTTGAGTFTNLGATTSVEAWAQGGGGAGAAVASCLTTSGNGGGGGAGGNFGAGWYVSGFTGGLAITVGAGGAGASTGNNNGGNGATSSFGGLLTAGGGGGGQALPNQSYAYWSPMGYGGTVNGTLSGANLFGILGQAGGFGVMAAAGGCNGNSAGGPGGGSFLGEGGASYQAGQGFAGSGYGSGSAGCCCSQLNTSGSPSVAGQPGIVIIREFA